MTEEEARVKWCPMIRVTPKEGERAAIEHCIGSACMMWRWDGKYSASKAGVRRIGDSEHGYCGLAGKA